jgi:putative membrane protein
VIVLKRPHGARLFFVLRGSILPRIAPALATCTALAVLVTVTHGFLLHWKVTLTPVPFSLIGLALAIFLGFRNTVAYDRYWEARRLWGDLVHRSRSFARQVESWVAPVSDGDDSAATHQVLIRRSVAFAHALRHELRETDASQDVGRWLAPSENEAFSRSRLGSDLLLRRIGHDLGACLRSGRLDPRLAAEMDATLSAMAAVAAGCERIKNTPIPFAYTLLLHRTAWLYCFLLPFGLVDVTGFMTPFVVAIVAYTFFGLDALGDEIEEPFGLAPHHLPLDALCRTIEISLLEALGVRDLPDRLLPVNSRLS